MAEDGRSLGQVERLALRQALHDVDEHHIGQASLRDALRSGRADVAGADDGDERVRHEGLRSCSTAIRSPGDRFGGLILSVGCDPGWSTA